MSATKAHILVVDDLYVWRDSLTLLLSANGYEVTTASSCEEAKEYLLTTRFSLAVLDICLDETDQKDQGGILIAEYIIAHHADIKIIFLTGYPDESHTAQTMRDGRVQKVVRDYIQKSDVSRLIKAVQNVLAS